MKKLIMNKKLKFLNASKNLTSFNDAFLLHHHFIYWF